MDRTQGQDTQHSQWWICNKTHNTVSGEKKSASQVLQAGQLQAALLLLVFVRQSMNGNGEKATSIGLRAGTCFRFFAPPLTHY